MRDSQVQVTLALHRNDRKRLPHERRATLRAV